MNSHSSSPLIGDKKKREMGRGTSSSQKWHFFRERMSSFSLELWEIEPLAVFGSRRKDVLRGAGYAWAPNL